MPSKTRAADMSGTGFVITASLDYAGLVAGEPAEPLERLRRIGLTILPAGDQLTVTNVAFGSYAKRIGLDVGYNVVAVMKKAEQPSSAIPVGIALLLTAGIAGLQYARFKGAGGRHPEKAVAH